MNRATVGPMHALAWTSAVTTWVTLWSWSGFAESGGRHMGTLLFCMAAVTGAGILSRMARLPVVVVGSAQLLTVMLCANLVWGTSLLPTQGSIEAVIRAFSDAVAAANKYAAPVPSTAASIGPIIVLGGLLIYVLVDLLAVTLNRVPVAGLPLLAAYSLPISMLDKQIGWLTFMLAAAGFLGMLALQENDRVNRWGRALVTDEKLDRSGFSVRAGSQHPAALGAWAIVIALVLPVLIPTFDLAELPGPGGSGGSGNNIIDLDNPMTDMQRDLVSEEDIPAIRAVTTNPDPRYLRVAVLTEFDENAWTPGNRDLDGEQQAIGTLPPPVGLDPTILSQEQDWALELLGEWDSGWLPTPMRLSAIDAGSSFGYDLETLDFHAFDDGLNISGANYSLTELDVRLDATRLSQATGVPGRLRERFTALPTDLTRLVGELANEVTAGQTTAYGQAVALQKWFRTDFAYSLDREKGSGGDALEKFLAPTGRVGYCEQFASAMAVMARYLRIPARVAVGFLEPDPVLDEPNTWVYSTRDLHAWPELYFEGIGWVLFEPTPSDRARTVPAYTRGLGPGAGPTDNPTTATSAPTTAAPRDPNETQSPTVPEQEGNGGQADDDSILLPVLGITALVLALLAVLAATPRWLRRRRTAVRWATTNDPAETAWAELRDSTIDLGLAWPAGRSPRAGARALARQFAAPLTPDSPVRPIRGRETNPDAAAAIDRIVAELEYSRYAPPGHLAEEVAELRAATEACVDALRSGVSTGARRRAEWLPASLVGRRRTRMVAEATPDLQQGDNLVDSLR